MIYLSVTVNEALQLYIIYNYNVKILLPSEAFIMELLFMILSVELMAMNGLRKKSPVIWLLLVFCCLLLRAYDHCCRLSERRYANDLQCLPSLLQMFPEIPIEVNDKNLDSMLKLYSPFVVDCWEIGCRPCELIDPTINEMAKDLKGRIAFGKLCIDQNAVTKNKYEISRTPTLLIFRNGTLVFKNVGNYPKQKLEEIILTVLRMR